MEDLRLNSKWFNEYNDYDSYIQGEDEYIDGLIDMQASIYQRIVSLLKEKKDGNTVLGIILYEMQNREIKP